MVGTGWAGPAAAACVASAMPSLPTCDALPNHQNACVHAHSPGGGLTVGHACLPRCHACMHVFFCQQVRHGRAWRGFQSQGSAGGCQGSGFSRGVGVRCRCVFLPPPPNFLSGIPSGAAVFPTQVSSASTCQCFFTEVARIQVDTGGTDTGGNRWIQVTRMQATRAGYAAPGLPYLQVASTQCPPTSRLRQPWPPLPPGWGS